MKLVFAVLLNLLAFYHQGYCRPTSTGFNFGQNYNYNFDDVLSRLKDMEKDDNDYIERQVEEKEKDVIKKQKDVSESFTETSSENNGQEEEEIRPIERVERGWISGQIALPRKFPFRSYRQLADARPNLSFLMLSDNKDDDDDDHYPFHEPI